MRFNQKIIKASIIKYKDTKEVKTLDQEFKSTWNNDNDFKMGTNQQMKNLRKSIQDPLKEVSNVDEKVSCKLLRMKNNEEKILHSDMKQKDHNSRELQ